MPLTIDWIKKQIEVYTNLIGRLGNDESDQRLKGIWQDMINTLEATLKVIELEMLTK